jgi:hypothetical protein
MRKIVSKEERAKRDRRNQLIIGGILILVMVGSVLGYAFGREQDSTDTEKIIYNGLEFTKTGNLWDVDTGTYQLSFLYNPEETEKINSALNPLSRYSNQPLYISSENSEAEVEIYRNLFYQNQIVQRVQNACFEGEKCEDETFPIKNCTDNLIIIKESNNTGIKQQNNCVFIEGSGKNLTKLSDSFLFKLTGIQ